MANITLVSNFNSVQIIMSFENFLRNVDACLLFSQCVAYGTLYKHRDICFLHWSDTQKIVKVQQGRGKSFAKRDHIGPNWLSHLYAKKYISTRFETLEEILPGLIKLKLRLLCTFTINNFIVKPSFLKMYTFYYLISENCMYTYPDGLITPSLPWE